MNNFISPVDNAKKILIADDDHDILEAMKMMLEMEGYDVVTTHNGKHVANMLNHHPDLLLLDIWMSGIDGRDICRKIKSKNSTKDVPIIMISASHEIAKSARASGADDFIAKPFQMNEILSKVAEHISAN